MEQFLNTNFNLKIRNFRKPIHTQPSKPRPYPTYYFRLLLLNESTRFFFYPDFSRDCMYRNQSVFGHPSTLPVVSAEGALPPEWVALFSALISPSLPEGRGHFTIFLFLSHFFLSLIPPLPVVTFLQSSTSLGTYLSSYFLFSDAKPTILIIILITNTCILCRELRQRINTVTT